MRPQERRRVAILFAVIASLVAVVGLVSMRVYRSAAVAEDTEPVTKTETVYEARVGSNWVAADEVELQPDEAVLGLVLNGEKKAFPIRAFGADYHVNDECGGQPVLATWCPMSHTGAIFDRRVDGRELTFRFAPFTNDDNLMLYDDATGSEWCQIERRSIEGSMKGAPLKMYPIVQTTWADWKRRHPDTRVMNAPDEMPFLVPYADSKVKLANKRLVPSTMALVVFVGDTVKIYPFWEVYLNGGSCEDEAEGTRFRVQVDLTVPVAEAIAEDGRLLRSMSTDAQMLGFFFEDIELYRAPR